MCLVNSVPFTSYEKEYIFEWVKNHLNSNNKKISWRLLQTKMEEKFGLLRSRNDLKNIWYTRKRQIDNRAKNLIHFSSVESVSTLLENYTFQPLYLLAVDETTNDMTLLETFDYSERTQHN